MLLHAQNPRDDDPAPWVSRGQKQWTGKTLSPFEGNFFDADPLRAGNQA